ncbi:MAG TPA: glycosyltransferase family 2 protein [Candidatus Methylomirabilis sp.]|nr:glycosyltransferase family 2 protein [Candidatus Methylomirabilis sp.]
MTSGSLARMATGYCGLVARSLAQLPRRVVLRRRYAGLLGLGSMKPEIARGDVAVLMRIKNEDFWIEPILRVVSKVFAEVVVIDSGSQDRTLAILDALATEGVSVRLFRHREPPDRMTMIANLIVDHCVRAEWVYLVDGDELQIESSCRALAEYCRGQAPGPRTRRIACHQLLTHPADILRCTRPLCPSVRYKHGRAYRRRQVRFHEGGLVDALVARLGPPGTNNLLKDSVFLDNAWILHCALNQRSTDPARRGFVDLLPDGETYRAGYRAPEGDYITLPFFPKEILECRHSGHNHYVERIKDAEIPLI